MKCSAKPSIITVAPKFASKIPTKGEKRKYEHIRRSC